jgi:hypothetical protein
MALDDIQHSGVNPSWGGLRDAIPCFRLFVAATKLNHCGIFLDKHSYLSRPNPHSFANSPML